MSYSKDQKTPVTDDVSTVSTGDTSEISYKGQCPDLNVFKLSLFDEIDRESQLLARTPRRFSGQSRFFLLRRIGSGGLGVVYLAEDRKLGRQVAVKVSKLANPWSSGQSDRFFREYQLTAKLQHPGVPAIFAAGRLKNGKRFYSMRFVEGRTFTELIVDFEREHRDIKSSRRAALISLLAHFKAVCDTVQAAHDLGYLHLDLKPENILVESTGATFVIDWGLAQPFLESDEPEHMAETAETPNGLEVEEGVQGSVGGTVEFMSTEQLAGRKSRFSRRTDVYALGGILQLILTGQPPRLRPLGEFKKSRFLSLFRKSTAIDGLDRERPTFRVAEAELASICDRALNQDPAKRFRSVKELRDEIERWEHGDEVQSHASRYHVMERVARFTARHARLLVPATLFLIISFAATGVIVAQRSALAVKTAEAARDKSARRATSEVALGSLQSQLRAVTHDKMLRHSELLPVRLKLLQNAWTQYDQWAADAIDDRALMVRLIHQLHLLTNVFEETVSELSLVQGGIDSRVAEQAATRAVDVSNRLHDLDPRDSEARLLLAKSLRNRARLTVNRDRGTFSRSLLDRARVLIQAVKEDESDDSAALFEEIRILRLYASFHFNDAMRADSKDIRADLLKQSLDLAEEAADLKQGLKPVDFETIRELTSVDATWALVLHKLGRVNDAILLHQAALDLATEHQPILPKDGEFDDDWVQHQRLIGRICNNYGLTLRGIGQPEKALAIHGRARDVRQVVVQRFPWLLAARGELAQSWGNIADTLNRVDVPAELNARRQALMLLRQTIKEFPSAPGVREFYGLHGVRSAIALHEQGDDTGALELFLEVLDVTQHPEDAELTNPDLHLDVAICHGLLAKQPNANPQHLLTAKSLVLKILKSGELVHPILKMRFLNEIPLQEVCKDREIQKLIDSLERK